MYADDDRHATVTIRDAEPADLDAIVEIDRQVSGSEKRPYWQDTLTLYGDHRGSRFFLVAGNTGRVIGFIMGEIRAWEFGSPACGWVFAIGVARDSLLEGVGSSLLHALCAEFRRAGVTKVRTMIARQDHEVLGFFRSCGMMAGPFLQLEMDLGSDPPADSPATGTDR